MTPSLRSLAATTAYRWMAALPFRVPADWAPTFLIGCGRSGTTFMVEALNQHPQLLALNEPRHIWRAIEPRTDVWQSDAAARHAQVVFDRNDADPHITRRCRRAFYARWLVSRRKVLVEKLPLNSFRLPWIDEMFPDCRFVNLVRNGLEVASSIEQRGKSWYGRGNWKWVALQELAGEQEPPELLGAATEDFFLRGLIEWTLSVDRVQQFLAAIDHSRSLTIRFEDLVRQPEEILRELQAFLQVTGSPDWMRQVAEQVRPPRPISATRLQGLRLPSRAAALFDLYQYGELLV